MHATCNRGASCAGRLKRPASASAPPRRLGDMSSTRSRRQNGLVIELPGPCVATCEGVIYLSGSASAHPSPSYPPPSLPPSQDCPGYQRHRSSVARDTRTKWCFFSYRQPVDLTTCLYMQLRFPPFTCSARQASVAELVGPACLPTRLPHARADSPTTLVGIATHLADTLLADFLHLYFLLFSRSPSSFSSSSSLSSSSSSL
ncbi:unnamed protein product [Protopolystoma xenopodis]|uniref:Uncharacterized protein n=1 Tax=Protopolystoma xenopodis TaxID=117903 RepID=A0A448XRZ7_9PLAT|nr:unnamed protein product [Protopolystoma xenopodis]